MRLNMQPLKAAYSLLQTSLVSSFTWKAVIVSNTSADTDWLKATVHTQKAECARSSPCYITLLSRCLSLPRRRLVFNTQHLHLFLPANDSEPTTFWFWVLQKCSRLDGEALVTDRERGAVKRVMECEKTKENKQSDATEICLVMFFFLFFFFNWQTMDM